MSAVLMEVQIPAGCAPGATLQITAPAGQPVNVVVPPTAQPGSTLTVIGRKDLES